MLGNIDKKKIWKQATLETKLRLWRCLQYNYEVVEEISRNSDSDESSGKNSDVKLNDDPIEESKGR